VAPAADHCACAVRRTCRSAFGLRYNLKCSLQCFKPDSARSARALPPHTVLLMFPAKYAHWQLVESFSTLRVYYAVDRRQIRSLITHIARLQQGGDQARTKKPSDPVTGDGAEYNQIKGSTDKYWRSAGTVMAETQRCSAGCQEISRVQSCNLLLTSPQAGADPQHSSEWVL
jgi:hypothetical protein